MSPTTDKVMIEGSPSALDDEGRVSFTELFGFMSVVAMMKKTNNRKIRSVIDEDEKAESILDDRLIAIIDYFCTGWFKISIKAMVVASILNTRRSMRATR